MKIRTLATPLFASLFCALLLLPAAVEAQSQNNSTQSVVEAAKRDRERKKNEKTPEKVITTDDLMPVASTDSSTQIAGPSSSAGTSSSDATQNATAQSSGESSGSAAAPDNQVAQEQQAAKLKDLKDQLANAKSDLDLVQRQIALQQDTYYSNPDYAHDTAGKAQLDQMQQQASDKKAALERLKSELAELQEKMGTQSSAATSSAAAQPQP
ncbi:MAG TPA: hypothetical protein VLV88_04530 [Terriglobales bacterium]|nr:hypothetical protein [Terriglobales bacterium]